tara:strand:- start:2337 stop:3209 length:873 start_codon:yes stop_codon:yes gene_type:complete
MYNLDELLNLFNLNYRFSKEDLLKAKKKVMMTHPDKSNLDAKYFLFYKKAYDIILEFYKNQNKHNDDIYDKDYAANEYDNQNSSTTKEMSKQINKIPTKQFQQKFNTLFEENMTSKPDPTVNEWFTSEENMYDLKGTVNKSNMNQMFEKVKSQQSNLVKYKGVQTLQVNGNSGNSLYDQNNDDYVSTDVFSKLKFDDLRKVHKDQTVLQVSEKDYQNIPKYNSVDQFVRARGKQTLTPLEKQKAEQLLAQENETYKQEIMQKEYEAKLRSMKNEEKNKHILSKFLYLKNN